VRMLEAPGRALRDGGAGRWTHSEPFDRKVTVGTSYMLKLGHIRGRQDPRVRSATTASSPKQAVGGKRSSAFSLRREKVSGVCSLTVAA